MKFLKRNWLPLSFITIIILMAYRSILHYEFVIDDVGSVDAYQRFKDLIPFYKSPAESTRSLMYLIMYTVGQGKPAAFHIVSLFFHIGSIWLIYAVISRMINRSVAFLVGLLAAVHPLFVEPVTWISGSPYVQYSFFALLSLLFYIHLDPVHAKSTSLSHHNKKFRWHIYTGALAAFIFATLMSEKAIVFPLLVALYEFSFGSIKKNWRRLLPFFLLSCLWTLFYIPRAQARIVTHANEYHLQVGLDNPLIQVPVAITSYFQLIFWPDKLSIYHSELLFGWPELIIRFVGFISFLGLIVFFFKKNKLIFFWLSWFFISLLPTLLPMRLSWVYAERYAYLGSMGIFTVVCYYYVRLFFSQRLRVLAGLIFFAVIASLTIRTYIRSLDWQSEDDLWIATAAASPSDFKTHNNVGTVYMKRGNNQLAEKEFLLALAMNKHYADPYYNLGLLYMNNNLFDHAEKNYLFAIKEKPTFWQAYNGLSIVYIANQKFDKGEEYAKKTVALQPQSPAGYNNLGLIYQVTGKYNLAIKNFKTATALNPDLWQTHLNLALLYYLIKDYSHMKESIHTAQKYAPETAEYYSRMAQVYMNIGALVEAKKMAQAALQLNPVDPVAEQVLKELQQKKTP